VGRCGDGDVCEGCMCDGCVWGVGCVHGCVWGGRVSQCIYIDSQAQKESRIVKGNQEHEKARSAGARTQNCGI
jgi:hypothetical protein